MIRVFKLLFILVTALLLQVVIFPYYLMDPFQPNLIMILTVWLGLQGDIRGGWILALAAGLIQDCFSGLYLGLHGFICLGVYFSLKMVADVLYADSRYLLIVVVFLATVASGVAELLLLSLYSVAPGLYRSLFSGLIPQALITTLCASLIAMVLPLAVAEERQ